MPPAMAAMGTIAAMAAMGTRGHGGHGKKWPWRPWEEVAIGNPFETLFDITGGPTYMASNLTHAATLQHGDVDLKSARERETKPLSVGTSSLSVFLKFEKLPGWLGFGGFGSSGDY